MNALLKIRDAGYIVKLKGENLSIKPAAKLLPNQLEFLKSHKAEIIEQLKAEAIAKQPKPVINVTRAKLHYKIAGGDGGFLIGDESDTVDTLTDLLKLKYGARLLSVTSI